MCQGDGEEGVLIGIKNRANKANEESNKKAGNFQKMKLFPPYIRIVIRNKLYAADLYGKK